MRLKVRLGVINDGIIKVIDIKVFFDIGVYGEYVFIIIGLVGEKILLMYNKVEVIRFIVDVVYINKMLVGVFRGYGVL